MKLLIILSLLFLPGVPGVSAEEYFLSCEEFDSVLEGLLGSDMETSIKGDLLEELIIATDPECFDS